MYRRRHFGAALALAALIPSAGAGERALWPAALKTAYHVRLNSTWPQEVADPSETTRPA